MPNIDDLDLDEQVFPHGTLIRQEEVARVIRANEPSAVERREAANRAQAALKAQREQEEQDKRDFEEFKRNRAAKAPATGSSVPQAVWAGDHG